MKKWLLILSVIAVACVSKRVVESEMITISSNLNGSGQQLTMEFVQGKSFNYPSFAVWIEDLEGNYIETLFVTQYVATGVYGRKEIRPGVWGKEPGEVRRPATMPYWAHKRNIQSPDGLFVPSPETALPDAITAATPLGNFKLQSALTENRDQAYRVLVEVNQPWDSNRFWTNAKFPGDPHYFTSLQPSLVFAATIIPRENQSNLVLNPIGHGHPSGSDGTLYTDLSTLTTAKEIFETITLHLTSR